LFILLGENNLVYFADAINFKVQGIQVSKEIFITLVKYTKPRAIVINRDLYKIILHYSTRFLQPMGQGLCENLTITSLNSGESIKGIRIAALFLKYINICKMGSPTSSIEGISNCKNTL